MAISPITDIVQEQIKSFINSTSTLPPSKRYERFDLDMAYQVAKKLHAWRCQNGCKSIGRKVGFTNQSIWAYHGLSTPIWAHIYENTVKHTNNNYACWSLNNTVLPRVEPEIVFKLHSTTYLESENPRNILKNIEWLALGFEIVDSHFPDWQFSPADAVADFGVHTALVVGTPLFVKEENILELADQLASFQVKMMKDNIVVEEGVGKNVLGNPALVLAHLQSILTTQQGAAPLDAGELITTGTITSALPIAPGERWLADISGIELPPLGIQFET